MKDAKTVIQELELLKKFCEDNISEAISVSVCRVFEGCRVAVVDAIMMIEEMEERLAIMGEQCETIPDKTGAEPDIEGGGSHWYHVCGECHGVIYRAWKFCPECGKKVKWS